MDVGDSPVRSFLALLLVAALWGISNPFLGRATALPAPPLQPPARRGGRTGAKLPASPVPSSHAVFALLARLARAAFWVPYAANQAGSLLYHWLLGACTTA